MSRLLRSCWAFGRGRDSKAGAVAEFAKAGTKFLVVPVIALGAALSGAAGDALAACLERAAAPFLVVWGAVYMFATVKLASEWGGAGGELEEVRLRRGRSEAAEGRGKALAEQVRSFEPGGGAVEIPNESCVACMTERGAGEKYKVLVCGHQPLCGGCLENWVAMKKKNAACPCCRQNLFQPYAGGN
jgi:hypothetical protein